MDEKQPDTSLNTWAIVEVMGHTVYAGLVTEQTVASQSFIRIDVPAVDGQSAFTKLLGAGSIFSITPCEEVIARGMVEARRTTAPIGVLCLPAGIKEQLRLGQQVMEAKKGDELFGYVNETRDDRLVCRECHCVVCRCDVSFESHDDDDCEADDA